jgi:hypothetical protein
MPQQRADEKLYELLGDKTAADNEKPSKKKKEKPAKVEVCFVYSCFSAFVLLSIKWLTGCLQFHLLY